MGPQTLSAAFFVTWSEVIVGRFVAAIAAFALLFGILPGRRGAETLAPGVPTIVARAAILVMLESAFAFGRVTIR